MMARNSIQMSVRQQPQRAQVVQENNPKNRKPIDPPPIVELKYENERDDPTNGQWLVSPRTFMMVTLIDAKDAEEPVPGKFLIGQTVSSLHRLKDINNKDGGFFVFGDISARKMGTFKLRFSLFDTSKETEEVVFMGHVDSDSFPVLAQRDFGSMSESTHLTRTFSDQGVKLRVRKDNRAISGLSNKRPYNGSPVASSSPHHTSVYGGAVQDQHYSDASPEMKRQRPDSDYPHQSLYQSMGVGENSMSHYGNPIPSSTRQWGTDDQGRGQNNYSQHSPLTLPTMGRLQSMNIPANTSWQGMNHQSALPSPSPSVSNHTPSYPSVSSQQQLSSSFGDPGSNSSIPRNYYSTAYQYASQSPYHAQHSGDGQTAYSDLHLPVTTLPDGTGLGSAQSHGYTHGYIPAGGIFGTEANEVSGAYAFIGDTSHTKF